MKILMTGGSGLLGSEMRKYFEFDAPRHSVMDITSPETLKGDYDVVIHAAAYTEVTMAETEKEKCININVVGTANMVKAFPDAYFVYISSEQVKIPTNFYLYTKLWGEEMVKQHKNYLIIRTLFKANPFPYKKAFIDQLTCGDYVDVIAPMIVDAILKKKHGTIDIGTERKTIIELARRTVPDIEGILVEDIKDVKLPYDYM